MLAVPTTTYQNVRQTAILYQIVHRPSITDRNTSGFSLRLAFWGWGQFATGLLRAITSMSATVKSEAWIGSWEVLVRLAGNGRHAVVGRVDGAGKQLRSRCSFE